MIHINHGIATAWARIERSSAHGRTRRLSSPRLRGTIAGQYYGTTLGSALAERRSALPVVANSGALQNGAAAPAQHEINKGSGCNGVRGRRKRDDRIVDRDPLARTDSRGQRDPT